MALKSGLLVLGSRLRVLQSVQVPAQVVVLIHKLLHHPRDVIQLVQAFENVVAAIASWFPNLIDGADGFARSTGAHRLTLFVGDGQYYAPVHPTRHVGLAVCVFGAGVFGIRFAPSGNFNLVPRCSVLNQELLHGISALKPQFFVVFHGAEVVGVAFYLDAITRMLVQQVGQPQQAGISIGKNSRVKFKIDFFPIVLRSICAQALGKAGHNQNAPKSY